MDCVQRAHLPRGETAGRAHEFRGDVDEQTAREQLFGAGLSGRPGTGDAYRATDLDEGDPARCESVRSLVEVGAERFALGLLDDQLDQRRRVGVEQARLSAQRDLPRAPRRPSSAP